jgi:hypothetical protein
MRFNPLPLAALGQAPHALDQRGERAGVRGGGTFPTPNLEPPLTLTLSPQAGRGDARGIRGHVSA